MAPNEMRKGADAQPLVRIIDDQPAVREAIADLLASMGMATRSYALAREFLHDDDQSAPGCVVLDVRMPEMGGFELVDALDDQPIELPVVFVTGHGDIPMAVRAMKAGAVDFLSKPFDDQRLIDAVNAANRIDAARRAKIAPTLEARERLKLLSDGERSVLDLIVCGLRNKQIAAELGISEITVKVRRGRLMDKLAVNSTVGLVRLVDQALEK
ncbi:response regulator transcription factor [Sphingomonas sp. GlSt437]|uniref:response regulator transcription factor n=1 Tax=Sphingomonas sp. GlSt437 TaxID=3389970 RepID=UPI003A846715